VCIVVQKAHWLNRVALFPHSQEDIGDHLSVAASSKNDNSLHFTPR
jgi:hypothetical protein